MRTQALPEETEERWYKAQSHRIQGEVLLGQDPHPGDRSEAEECFQQALTIARRQQAKYDELRASTNLARLWHQQGERAEAHDPLAPAYNWFTEGFDMADLKDTKALLEELA